MQAFVNTVDLDQGTDLDDPRALADWLELWGLAPAGLAATPSDLKVAKEVREALRTLIGGTVSARANAAARIDRVTRAAPVVVRIDAEGRGRFEAAAEDVAGALGHLCAVLVTAQADGTWERFKICPGAKCRAAFYDFSRNHSAVWCSSRCGSRVSSLAYRGRNLDRIRKKDRANAKFRGFARRFR